MYSPIGIAAAKRVITNDEFKEIFRNAGNLYLENNSSVNIQKMKRVIKNGIKNVLNIANVVLSKVCCDI